MDTHQFELVITRIEKKVTPDMSLAKRIGARTFNAAQKQTYGGLVKLFTDGFKIPRKEITNDNIQVIQVTGSLEFCTKIKLGIEGIQEEKLQEFVTGNPSFFQKIKKKASDAAQEVKGKGFFAFQQMLALEGIVITMTVGPIKSLQNYNIVKQKASK